MSNQSCNWYQGFLNSKKNLIPTICWYLTSFCLLKKYLTKPQYPPIIFVRTTDFCWNVQLDVVVFQILTCLNKYWLYTYTWPSRFYVLVKTTEIRFSTRDNLETVIWLMKIFWWVEISLPSKKKQLLFLKNLPFLVSMTIRISWGQTPLP